MTNKEIIHISKQILVFTFLIISSIYLGIRIKSELIRKELNQVTVTKIKTVPINQIDKTIINTFKK